MSTRDAPPGLTLNLRGVRVLVVEDHDASRELLCRIVQSFGATVRAAADGWLGLNSARSQKPDLILCDLVMPGLDGFGLLRQLRADPELCRVAVIAVSALGDEADFWRTWEAGFNGHLVKPIDYDIIATQLTRIFWAHALAPDGLPSLVTQRRHRVDARRAARRQVAREQGDGSEH